MLEFQNPRAERSISLGAGPARLVTTRESSQS